MDRDDVRKRLGLSRRDFLRLNAGAAAWLGLGGLTTTGCGAKHLRSTGKRVIALGLDGMDPQIVSLMMKDGKLPTFARLARDGTFGPLGTSDPPQSPVAWANFITGTNPGKHGIYDFVHRDPKTLFPYLSTSQALPPEKTANLGDYVIPLSSGSVENLRKGRAFWEVLEDHDVPATVFKIPSNFPPTETKQRTISGMGTPDILGTYGMFSYFTDSPVELDETLGGGYVYKVDVSNDVVHANLFGPPNSFLKDGPATRAAFDVHRDPVNAAARISVQGAEFLLAQGEWSPWIRVTFDLLAGLDVKGMCRFYLKEAHPGFKLYVTPINIDPSAPSMPISTPASYASELADKVGLFHTKGLPADTKALDQGVLDDGEFLAQDDIFLEEKLAIYEHELERFDEGLLFYYISNTDQRAHMFWRHRDKGHPAHDDKLAGQWGTAIEDIYVRMDRLLERTLEKVDDRTTLLAFSDHGFAPYYQSFHLNSWLRDQGFLVLKPDSKREDKDIYADVDWSKTRAYAIGFNSLYVNEKGRDAYGSVSSAQKASVVDEIAKKLGSYTDPVKGTKPVIRARKTSECYSGDQGDKSPDIIVGYNRGYRASWQTALGGIPDGDLFALNENKWSGDHCMDSGMVPGTFLINRKAKRDRHISLLDLNATILDVFGAEAPAELDGKSIL